MVLLWMVACAPIESWPRGEVSWRELVLTAAGDAHTTGMYERRTVELQDGWGVRTVHTEGEVRVGTSDPLRFDSSLPRGTDPWSLRWEHAVSAIPAHVELDETGRPVRLQNAAEWREQAARAVATLPAPGARRDGTGLLDPEGYVHDLARTFPGVPSEGEWRRSERVAGVDSERVETCVAAGRRDGGRRFRCDGTAMASTREGPQLHDTQTWTEVWLDHRGLIGVESGYSGTRVQVVGGFVSDQAIAAQRLVTRTVDVP